MNETAQHFARDYEDGHRIEKALCAILPMHGFLNPVTTESKGKFSDFDIETKYATFEVKYDRMASKTGNVFFEIYCNGEPSGISVTKAHFFTVVVDTTAYTMPTDVLREWLKEMLGMGLATWKTNAGDDGKVKGLIVSRTLFEPSRCSRMAIWLLDV